MTTTQPISRRRMIAGAAAGASVAWVAPAVVRTDIAGAASPVDCIETTVVDTVPFESSGYRYKQVASGALPGFEQPGFDDSGFSTGAGAFGTYAGGATGSSTICSSDPDEGPMPPSTTNWDINTDLLVRRDVTIAAQTVLVTVDARYDNFVEIWWDGVLLADLPNGGRCGGRDTVTVPEALCTPGTHLLALRGTDIGGETYLDARVASTRCA